jgi:thioredoxin 1
MMATETVTQATFPESVRQGTVALAFWAEWCGPCRAFAPVFEATSRRHANVVFGKVDTETEAGLATAFEIRAIPTLIVIRDGVLLGAFPAAMPGARLELINQVRALDMKEVRHQLDADEGGTNWEAA